MASLRSLGVHKPSALSYLVAESILCEDANQADYTWEIYRDTESKDAAEEEVVTTEHYVVWSRGGVVRKVFNFEIEQEKVIQAILTWFPVDETPPTHNQTPDGPRHLEGDLRRPSTAAAEHTPPCPGIKGRARALVVFLKSQAHVFFLSGATHVVHLPFELDRAFQTPRGLILQRKIPSSEVIPPTPVLPSAPPNSFLSTAQSLSQSLSQSFAHPARRLGSALGSSKLSKSIRPGSANALFLEDLLKSSTASSSDSLPRLFSFTDPLSELGLVVNVINGAERSSFLTVNGSGHRRLEPIEKSEEILYVSDRSEVAFGKDARHQPLLLVITANHETNLLTIWSASYVDPKSISSARRPQTSLSSKKVRRRSSYGPTAPGTGATTPAVRASDRIRESFGGAARSKTVPPSFNAASSQNNKDRVTDQAVEDALASQLNPVYDLSRQPKESRRVSSLLSRAELSTSFDKSAFQDLAANRNSVRTSFGASFGAGSRRGQSLGGYNDRNSLGASQTRHRASTPGSVSRMSLSGLSMDDTLDDAMDEDSYDTLDDFDDLDDLLTGGASAGGLGQESMNSLRKELVLNRIAEIPVSEAMRNSQLSQATKVFTLAAPFNPAAVFERRVFLYIANSAWNMTLECELAVTRKRLSAISSTARNSSENHVHRYVCVAKLVKHQQRKNSIDAIKIFDKGIERALRLSQDESGAPMLSVTAGWSSHVPASLTIGSLKLFNPFSILNDSPNVRKSAGLKRTISPRQPLQKLDCAGLDGTFTIVDREQRRHRLKVQLAPRERLVSHIFQVLSAVLPNYVGDLLLEIWWSIRKLLSTSSDQSSSPEWTALVATLFSMAVPFMDNNKVKKPSSVRTTQRSSRRISSTPRGSASVDSDLSAAWNLMRTREAARSTTKTWNAPSWNWVQRSKPSFSVKSSPSSSASGRTQNVPTIAEQLKAKRGMIPHCADVARHFGHTPIGKATNDQWRRLSTSENQDLRTSYLPHILVALHLLREENKLDLLLQEDPGSGVDNLTPILAQLGRWLHWDSWSFRRGGYYDLDGGSAVDWEYEESFMKTTGPDQSFENPPSIFEWLRGVLQSSSEPSFPSLTSLIRKPTNSPHSPFDIEEELAALTPRTSALNRFFGKLRMGARTSVKAVELMARSGISTRMLATFPEAAKASLMEAIVNCQSNPPTTWSSSLLKLVHREDLDLALAKASGGIADTQYGQSGSVTGLKSDPNPGAARDVRTVCALTDQTEKPQAVGDAERHAITRLIFSEDRRWTEAYNLLEPLKQTVAEYIPDSRSEEAVILEAQRTLMQWVMLRTFSLPTGNAMMKYNSRRPLLTERFPLYGFSTTCLMKPMGNVVTADRATYSEEKFGWAFFHSGVTAGLSISRDAQGIDTSWVIYNKPADLNNRHAGLLLGLGLNGHLKEVAKWLSFKYLTPKHTMTSIGILLGMSASYMGTMDTLITRLLSVHVTRMLPPGAAELNISPFTQTTGLMGIGLLYYNTQHRRMSEVMLSEIEHVDRPDPAEPPDSLRDEGYRLAAGFALGFINLGKGNDLRGLHDMRLLERLLAIVVGPKAVDIVHILDQATAGAVIAIALIFMKTQNEAVARKIDVPDTLPQFDYVRPDIFLLRTLAKHLIMWDNIRAEHRWMIRNLPPEYQDDYQLKNIRSLRSEQMPFFNIVAGLLWSISLKHAGTGDIHVRDFLIRYLDQFMRICRLPAHRYDAKLTRNTIRNCQDLTALAVATVMAGTGDLDVFRRLRALHGRFGPDTPYGSHLAAHMAFGALFIAGGTHTFSTSNKAIASLICSFYPLFPMEANDNKAHLQAFRHFWVLAADPRCLIVRDVDTARAISMSIILQTKDGNEKALTAPCLLPELDAIASIKTTNAEYWPATLDFANNALHLDNFKRTQTMRVRRRTPHDMYNSVFSSTLVALNDAQVSRTTRIMWDWLFTLPALMEFEKADVGLILPLDPYSSTFMETSETIVDERLALRTQARSWRRDDLWDLRVLFEWAERSQANGGRLEWLGREVVERLKAGILERGRRIEG